MVCHAAGSVGARVQDKLEVNFDNETCNVRDGEYSIASAATDRADTSAPDTYAEDMNDKTD